MVTYDWRICPAPNMNPPTVRPADTGLPRGDYETGVLADQGPMTNYGPLSSEFGPRFPRWDDAYTEAACKQEYGSGDSPTWCLWVAAGLAALVLLPKSAKSMPRASRA